MVIYTKKINDPIDVVQKLSRLIHQQEERIERMLEREAQKLVSDPQVGKEMKVLEGLLQHSLNMSFDLGLLKRTPKVVPEIALLPTPAQSKFRDQTMHGMQEQERARAKLAQAEAAQAEAVRRAAHDEAVREFAAIVNAPGFPTNGTQEEWEAAYDAGMEKLNEAKEKGLLH